jgi:argininosuccinate synthase
MSGRADGGKEGELVHAQNHKKKPICAVRLWRWDRKKKKEFEKKNGIPEMFSKRHNFHPSSPFQVKKQEGKGKRSKKGR